MAAPLFVTLNCFVILESSYQIAIETAGKKVNTQKYEDYTFEGTLTRAKEECSYMSLVNETVVRNRTLHMIKEKIAHKKLKEFYQQKELEKQKAKEFYENIEKQSRRRALEGGHPPRFPLPGPFPPLPPPPPQPPFRNIYKRSTELNGRRRKGSTLFSEVSFADHNNCSSRCLFARMEMENPQPVEEESNGASGRSETKKPENRTELRKIHSVEPLPRGRTLQNMTSVDANGFPDESLIAKLIEDKISNKKIRQLKTKKVNSCFKKMEEVAFDDSCIFSSRLFDCLDLGETSWSGLR